MAAFGSRKGVQRVGGVSMGPQVHEPHGLDPKWLGLEHMPRGLGGETAQNWCSGSEIKSESPFVCLFVCFMVFQ